MRTANSFSNHKILFVKISRLKPDFKKSERKKITDFIK